MPTAFQKLLFESFLVWQKDSGKSLPQAAYASYLRVTPGALSNYLNGKRTPRSKKEIEKLAERLGQAVYDALGLPRPDPLLQLVIDNWGLLPDAVKAEIVETVERAEARGPVGDSGKGLETSKRRRAASN